MHLNHPIDFQMDTRLVLRGVDPTEYFRSTPQPRMQSSQKCPCLKGKKPLPKHHFGYPAIAFTPQKTNIDTQR